MFNLIAQYIGYGADVEPVKVEQEIADCLFGETEEGDWTLVEVQPETAIKIEDDFQRIPSPSPVVSMHSSTADVVDGSVVPAASQTVNKRPRCGKSTKRVRQSAVNYTQHRSNQIRRTNQVFYNRGNKAAQKMRQIVHQPRKFY